MYIMVLLCYVYVGKNVLRNIVQMSKPMYILAHKLKYY